VRVPELVPRHQSAFVSVVFVFIGHGEGLGGSCERITSFISDNKPNTTELSTLPDTHLKGFEIHINGLTVKMVCYKKKVQNFD
jgi:hypothetical protein